MARRKRRKPVPTLTTLDFETYTLKATAPFQGRVFFGDREVGTINSLTMEGPDDVIANGLAALDAPIVADITGGWTKKGAAYLEKMVESLTGSLGQSYDQWKAHQFSVDLHRHLVLSAPYGKPGRDLEAEIVSGLAHKVERQKALIETMALLPGTTTTTTRHETTWWDQPVIKKPRDPYADIVKIWENMNAMTKQRRAAIRRAAMSEASRSLFLDANAQAGVAKLRERYPTVAEPWKDVKPAAQVDPATVREAVREFLTHKSDVVIERTK